MSQSDALKLLVVSDIHYGNDYTYVPKIGTLKDQTCTVRGAWGNVVMPLVINTFKTDGYDLLLDIGDKHSGNKVVLDTGKIPLWVYELQSHFARAGLGKVLDVKGNHCGQVAQHLGFAGLYLGYPARPHNEDFRSSYHDIKGFRIVQSNAGTRQMSSSGRFIPPEHMRWLDDVIGSSPYPVILLQHVPPDEFDNGHDFYERLAKMEMVALVIHGHRHEPTTMEFPNGIPVLHMQALLFENEPPLPGGNIVSIEIKPDEMTITSKTLLSVCGTERSYKIDRRDLSLIEDPVFSGCILSLKPEPA